VENGPVVLVVERDVALRDVLMQMLADLGCRPTAVVDILAVPRIVQDGAIAAVVAGTWGPSRRHLLDVERAQIRYVAESAPLILLSGAAWTKDFRPDELGARCILEHPFDIDALESELQRCLSD
jgi:DNA-binding NtrC family response regulator